MEYVSFVGVIRFSLNLPIVHIQVHGVPGGAGAPEEGTVPRHCRLPLQAQDHEGAHLHVQVRSYPILVRIRINWPDPDPIRIRPLVFKENCHQKGKEAEGHKHWSTKPCCFVSSSLKVTSK